MDRKVCVLLYSNHSKASLDVLNYIKNIPIDFLTITGMTMICIDNPEFKLILHNNGITHVPTLLVEYYSGSKQKFERDYIYMWIDQIITRNLGISEHSAAPGPETQLSEPNEQNTLRVNRTPIHSNTTFGGMQSIPGTKSAGGPEGITHNKGNEVSSAVQAPQQDRPTPDTTIPMNLNKKPDIAAIALEMQKNRDIELAEIKEYQKPI